MRISLNKLFRFSSVATLTLVLLACGGGGGSSSGEAPPPASIGNPPPTPVSTTPPEVTPTLEIDGFDIVSDAEWSSTAVQKVLHTFALGGHASQTQIDLWADMHPVTAIEEMLNFNEHNAKLSPSVNEPDQLALRSGKLTDLAAFWASDDPSNGMPADRREGFDYENNVGFLEPLWPFSATLRGLNPFRAYVLYHEVNQHMVANASAGVPPLVLMSYYDSLGDALEQGVSYDQVIAIAASSAAIALQYGHSRNRYVNDRCRCNEDFAREFYQLFFGITGNADPLYHETVTIKNTAKALTDMRLARNADDEVTAEVTYGTEQHFSGPLEMLNEQNLGTNAQMRLQSLSAIAIEHPESLANLPVMLIEGLADDNLSESGKQRLRSAWASMAQKDLLLFLRAYAVSKMFHSDQRIKYLSSLHRRILITNKISSRNEELYNRIYSVTLHTGEGVKTFRPTNNVFGGQTGLDAAASADVFRSNYNDSTFSSWRYRQDSFASDDYAWTKDWRQIIPRGATGNFRIDAVAEWLWKHLLADDGQLMGPLERAHLYALLGTRSDLNAFADATLPDKIYSVSDVQNTELATRLSELGQQTLPLDSTDADERSIATRSIGQAVSFIIATPYMFYQTGNAAGNGS